MGSSWSSGKGFLVQTVEEAANLSARYSLPIPTVARLRTRNLQLWDHRHGRGGAAAAMAFNTTAAGPTWKTTCTIWWLLPGKRCTKPQPGFHHLVQDSRRSR